MTSTGRPEPLATAEIALMMQLDLGQTRNALTNVGHFHPAGADGYWTSVPATTADHGRAHV